MGCPSRPERGSWSIQSSQKPTPEVYPWVGFPTQALCIGDPCRGTPDPPSLCPRPAFYTTSSLAGLLALGAVLGAVATVREAGGLMAGVSAPCPQSPRLWDAIRSRQEGEPREPALPTVSGQRGLKDVCQLGLPTCPDQGPSARPCFTPPSTGARKAAQGLPDLGAVAQGPGSIWFCTQARSPVGLGSCSAPGGLSPPCSFAAGERLCATPPETLVAPIPARPHWPLLLLRPPALPPPGAHLSCPL